MTPSSNDQFNHYYSLHCKHLRLNGYQPKTIEAYSRAIRRIGHYFDYQVDNLSHDQLLDYFHDLLQRLSWSAVKLDLYGLRFFYTKVLNKPWVDIPVISRLSRNVFPILSPSMRLSDYSRQPTS
jgi:integrase/recombinase XerD